MSTQGTRGVGNVGAELPAVVPAALPRATRLSWELGTRVTGDDATLCGEWECTAAPWTLAAFEVTDHTAVVRLTTPVGREQFYEVPIADLDAVEPTLSEAADWRPT